MKVELFTTGLLAGLASASFAKRAQQIADCLGDKNVPVRWENSPDYAALAEPYNLRLPYKPKVIVLPETAQHVQDAVKCAAAGGFKVQARSGGHSYASYSLGGQDGSVVISLQAFNNVSLNKETNVVTVGGGVRLGNLAQGIWDQGKRALAHGTCPGVGVGGHFSHGGYGHTSRHWGLALDHIIALDVVLADGSFVRADALNYPEVYWALRGAADSFGIIVNFILNTHPAPESVTYFSLRYGDKMLASRDTFATSFRHLERVSLNKSIIDNRISYGIYLEPSVYSLSGTFFGSTDEFKTKILPELTAGNITTPNEIVVQSYDWIGYLELMAGSNLTQPLTGYDKHENFFAKSLTVPEAGGMSTRALNAFYDYIKQPTSVTFYVIINLYGGPGSEINNKDTSFAAYSDRNSLWVFQNYATVGTQEAITFMNGLNDAVIKAQHETLFGAYLNYVDPTYSAEEAHSLYYGRDLATKLEEYKAKYDPQSTFWNPQSFGQKA